MKLFISLLLLLTSLSASENLEKVSLQLKWMYQFQFAGFIVAKEKGYYKEVGLDVDLIEFAQSDNIIEDLMSRKIDFGVGDSTLVLGAMRGTPITAMLNIYVQSPFVLIALKSSKIKSLLDAKNKKIALFGMPNGVTLDTMLASQKIDYIREPASNKFDRLINKEIDLMSAYISNEPFLMKERGIDITIFNPIDYGFDAYGDILFTSRQMIEEKPETVGKMYEASKKGFLYAFSHIDETVELIYQKYNTQNKSKAALKYEANALKKMMLLDENFGRIKEEKIQSIAQIYSFMIQGKYDLDNLKDFIYHPEENIQGLTYKEKEWIKLHPVITYSEIDWEPLSIIKNNKMTGLMGDYLDSISQRTGITFKFIPSASWPHVLKQFEEKKIDLVPGIGSSSEEIKLGLVSNVYKTYPMAIVTGKNFKFVNNLSDLVDKTIAVPKYYTSYNYIVQNYPHIKLITTENIPESLLLVEEGKADAFVGHIATSLHYISELHLPDLKISGRTTFKFEHAFLIKKEYPELLSIINKTLGSITEQEKAKIDSRWVKTTVEQKVDYTLVFQILGVTFILILLFLSRNRQLTKHNVQLKKQKDILHHQAHHDALTELPNRLLFYDRLQQGIEKAKRNKTQLGLFFIDLDRFKEINDSLGHEIGDQVLTIVAERFQKTIRAEDTLARLGGDEFTVIVEELKRGQDAAFLAQKLLDVMTQPIIIESHTLYVTGSIGISLYPKDDEDATNLLKYADAAMYRAKDEGRNNFQFYSAEMTELAFERLLLESSLRDAIKNEEFIVYYQPQIDGETDKLIGMEALVRWQHPTLGIVSPLKFIPFAEETGLIVEIDRLVMKSAMKQVSQWYAEGLNPGILSLNLAMKQLKTDDFLENLEETISTCNFKHEWLKIEITESAIMQKPKESISKLAEIHKLGISIAIDDFGTGYSSLSYLKRLPIHTLKIDQSFIRDIPNDEEDVAIVKAIIALANSLSLKLIAEGVETEEQKIFLLENGCTKIQGYFYSYPLPGTEMETRLLKDK